MKIELCSAINHPWQIKPPIVVLKDGSRRVRLVCERCGSIRYDSRSPTGAFIRRSYDHTQGYDKFLESTTVKSRRLDAWKSAMADAKEISFDARGNTTLRLVHDKTKKVRRPKSKPVKRARDKRRAHA